MANRTEKEVSTNATYQRSVEYTTTTSYPISAGFSRLLKDEGEMRARRLNSLTS